MIDPDRRNAIYQLHLAGVPLGKIGRQFHVSPRTVRTIIRQQGAMPQTVRKDKIHIDPELLRAAVPAMRRLARSASTRSWWRTKGSRSAIPP